ncbi:DUF4405 domain-containing protein [Anaerotignum faecicola]|nr:DUF4405 domain-containing protein [Anaerotignum faecicola]
MKPRMIQKMFIDIFMTILLLCQMPYMLIGEIAHEWIGIAMFILFILHHILNWRWYRSLLKGKYTMLRIVHTVINFFVLFCMIGLMISSVIISREVFSSLPIEGRMGFARLLHMASAYWGFIFMSIHIGLHWGMIMNLGSKALKQKKLCKAQIFMLRIIIFFICIIGIYEFLENDLLSYMFLKNQFVFFDVNQPLPIFLMEYISMMVFWICISYYTAKVIKNNK